MAQIIDLSDVKRRHTGHFFDRGATRFFRSRYARYAYTGPGGTYFVTSEQFVPSQGPAAPRKYSVRRVRPNGDIDTVGKFNDLSQHVAHRLARQWADVSQEG